MTVTGDMYIYIYTRWWFQTFFWAYYFLGGGFKHFLLFIPDVGEMIQFDVRICFTVGCFNHQLDKLLFVVWELFSQVNPGKKMLLITWTFYTT